MKITAVDPESDLFVDAFDLYRRHKSTLGFMPVGGFEERASRGTLLCALDDAGLAGFVLYDLPGRRISLRLLCVAERSRSDGVARALVEDLVARHPGREGIRLRCRNDYEAHRLWPHLDFEPVAESAGRSHAGDLLTTWWRDFNLPNLFDFVEHDPGARRRVALDTDVFLDLVEPNREGAKPSQGLLSDWVLDHARLGVTKELLQEIHNSADVESRETRRRQAATFERMDQASGAAAWESVATELLDALDGLALSDHDQRDVRHVARAIGAGAEWFASRDERLRRLLAGPGLALGISVIAPSDLVQLLWSQSEHAYAPAQLEGTAYEWTSVGPNSIEALARRFVGASEGFRQFREHLREVCSQPESWEVRVLAPVSGGDPEGLLVSTEADDVLEVSVLRTRGVRSPTIYRQLVALQRTRAVSAGLVAVKIGDRVGATGMADTFAAEGFVEVGSTYWAAPMRGILSASELGAMAGERTTLPTIVFDDATRDRQDWDRSPEMVDQVERLFAPLKIRSSGLATYLVPIQPHFAADLFDDDLSSQQLFDRPPSLGLSREQVFYTGSSTRLEAPARILWYVTKGGKAVGTGAVRACSRLEEVVRDRPLTLHRRFGHLGVWDTNAVLSAANGRSKLTALRFSDTEALRPVELVRMEEIALQLGSKVFLRAPTRISEHMFDRFYEEGQP